MPRRLVIIFRALSALTLLEGLAGLFSIAMTLMVKTFFGHGELYISRVILYAMASANLGFNVVLFFAGALLWKLQRKGLLVLVWCLIGEILYFLALSSLSMHLWSAGHGSIDRSNTLAAMMGVGNSGLSFQLATAFPIVAGILIFLAYRYLGIPARPLKMRTH